VKRCPAIVVKKNGTSPAIQEEILEAVVVVVAPARAHRDAGLALIEVGHPSRSAMSSNVPFAAIREQAFFEPSPLLVT
jgi:hypothetical protein